MTDQLFPITPPPELLMSWEDRHFDEKEHVDVLLIEAYQAGADQELEACCEWLKAKEWVHPEFSDELRAARRPKPPSLKEQAFALLGVVEMSNNACNSWDFSIIRRALEALDD